MHVVVVGVGASLAALCRSRSAREAAKEITVATAGSLREQPVMFPSICTAIYIHKPAIRPRRRRPGLVTMETLHCRPLISTLRPATLLRSQCCQRGRRSLCSLFNDYEANYSRKVKISLKINRRN